MAAHWVARAGVSAHRGRLDGVKVLPLAMVQDCPLSGAKDLQGSEGRPVAASAQQVAPMGSGLPAERSKGSARVRWSPRAGVGSSWPPDGSGMAAELSEGLQWSNGRPVAASAQQVAPMGVRIAR